MIAMAQVANALRQTTELTSCGSFVNRVPSINDRENSSSNVWQSDRPLPGMPTPQQNLDVNQHQNSDNQNNNNSHTSRSEHNSVPVFKISPVFMGVTSFLVISTGVVCLVFYFGSKNSHRKDLLVAGMSLIVLGLTLTCLREWYCSPNTNQNHQISCMCFRIVSSSSSPLATRRAAQTRPVNLRNQEVDPPTYASLNYIVNNEEPLASQSSFFKVTLESNCGSVENESYEEELSPPTYNEVVKIKRSFANEPSDTNSGRQIESDNVAGSSNITHTPQSRPSQLKIRITNALS